MMGVSPACERDRGSHGSLPRALHSSVFRSARRVCFQFTYPAVHLGLYFFGCLARLPYLLFCRSLMDLVCPCLGVRFFCRRSGACRTREKPGRPHGGQYGDDLQKVATAVVHAPPLLSPYTNLRAA